VSLCTAGYAAVTFGTDRPDLEQLERYIQELRSKTLSKKLSYLSLSGDVRVTWRHERVMRDGIDLTGPNSDPHLPNQAWISEINMILDVGKLPAWSMWKINFRSRMGQLSGSKGELAVQRALVGLDFADTLTREVYIQAGREMLSDDFESRIEFNTLFDGVMFSWTEKVERFGDYYIKGGPMIVDFGVGQYGWIAETGVEELAGSGAFVKVNYIDWEGNNVPPGIGPEDEDRREFFDEVARAAYRFQIVQYLAGYWFEWECFPWPFQPYAAYLQNYVAEPVPSTHGRKEDKAFYAGFSLGKLSRPGDWVIDLNYQWVQALAIPQFDVSGIGNGLPVGPEFRREVRFFEQGRGNTNYRGWAFKGSMNVTKSLIGQLKYEWSQPIIRSIGGRGLYNKVQMQFLFVF
jgi:hypothetical protein